MTNSRHPDTLSEEITSLHPATGQEVAGVEAVERLLESLLDDYERSLANDPGAGDHPSQPAAARDTLGLHEIATRLREVTESDLRAEAERLRARAELLLETSESATVVLDPLGSVVAANRAATGLGDRLGSPVTQGRPWALLEGVGRLRSGVVTRDTADGGRRVLLLSRRLPQRASSDEEVIQILDLTSAGGDDASPWKSLETVSSILQSLSVLCHDINNPLTTLAGRAQLLRARAGDQPHLHKAATVIHESAIRVADLVRSLAGKIKEARAEAVEGLRSNALQRGAEEQRRKS